MRDGTANGYHCWIQEFPVVFRYFNPQPTLKYWEITRTIHHSPLDWRVRDAEAGNFSVDPRFVGWNLGSTLKFPTSTGETLMFSISIHLGLMTALQYSRGRACSILINGPPPGRHSARSYSCAIDKLNMHTRENAGKNQNEGTHCCVHKNCTKCYTTLFLSHNKGLTSLDVRVTECWLYISNAVGYCDRDNLWLLTTSPKSQPIYCNLSLRSSHLH